MLALVLVSALVCSAVAQLPTNCGVPAIKPTLAGSRIVSQTEAVANSWPWQVQIRIWGGHTCGASIISDKYLLTAAHCVEGLAQAYSYRAGRHTSAGSNEPHEQISAGQHFRHENYRSNNTYIQYDVAVVRLSTPFTFNDYVSPVCLADTVPAVGTNVWVTGWGRVQGTCCEGKLKQGLLSVVDHETCRTQFLASDNSIKTVLDHMLCAGKPNGYPSACNGDSGGPLVRQASDNSNKFVQVGIVSWGKGGCINTTLPNVYTDVAKFRSWIVGKISDLEEEEALVSRNVHFQPRMGAAFRALAKSLEPY